MGVETTAETMALRRAMQKFVSIEPNEDPTADIASNSNPNGKFISGVVAPKPINWRTVAAKKAMEGCFIVSLYPKPYGAADQWVPLVVLKSIHFVQKQGKGKGKEKEKEKKTNKEDYHLCLTLDDRHLKRTTKKTELFDSQGYTVETPLWKIPNIAKGLDEQTTLFFNSKDERATDGQEIDYTEGSSDENDDSEKDSSDDSEKDNSDDSDESDESEKDSDESEV